VLVESLFGKLIWKKYGTDYLFVTRVRQHKPGRRYIEETRSLLAALNRCDLQSICVRPFESISDFMGVVPVALLSCLHPCKQRESVKRLRNIHAVFVASGTTLNYNSTCYAFTRRRTQNKVQYHRYCIDIKTKEQLDAKLDYCICNY
jgi:hypothetical protein